jgi:hypothetical protein
LKELKMKKLVTVQRNLKANKSKFNNFGKYRYRSCEDILEAVKPLLEGMTLVISDEVVLIGDRYYIKATATLKDVETGETESSTAYAREALDKKGMDESQITGTASSYARKYALNGLLCIDDTKDADTMDNNLDNNTEPVGKEILATKAHLEELRQIGVDVQKVAVYYKTTVDGLTDAQVVEAIGMKKR